MEDAGRIWTRRVPITVSELDRRAVNARHGQKGMATIANTIQWIIQQGDGVLEDAVYEYQNGHSRPDEEDEPDRKVGGWPDEPNDLAEWSRR